LAVTVTVIDVQPDGHRLAELRAAVDAGALTPRLVHAYPFAQVAEAHRRQAKGGIRGRLVLVP
jgi:NADPH2:quinone reductase